MQKKRLVLNTALLTLSSLLMSGIGMAFQAWLVKRIGPTGIGLYQLTLSVTNLGATFAISGIRFAATRLVAEELGAENPGGIRAAMRRCLAYGSFFGLAALLILYFLADPIGGFAIRDVRTTPSLKIAAFSMPCISLCAALSGYFTACGRVWKPTLVHLLEQLASIGFVAGLLSRVPGGEIEKSCAAVTLGRLGGDLLSLFLMFLAYILDRRGQEKEEGKSPALTGRMLRIAVPLAVSAYARSALSTLQHLLVPRGLRSAGFSADRALAGYGVVQGMVMPILFFPSCLLGALAELIVPELTEAQVRGDSKEIRRASRELIQDSFLYSAAVALFLFFCADPLAWAVYKSSQAGQYIRILAPLVPLLYTDMTVDGCLKGLGQQVWSMGFNILDALLGLLLVVWLLPRYAFGGYLVLVYVTESFNFVLSALRLRRVLSRCAPGDGRRPCGESERCAYRAAG